MEKRTTIQIRQETLDKLKTFRKVRRETYDEILNRLMEESVKEKWK